MKNVSRGLSVLVLSIIVALPAYLAAQTKAAQANPNQVMHIYKCNVIEGKTDAQVVEGARLYLNALRQLDGGKELKMKLLWPVAVNNLGEIDFHVVLISPSFAEWGRMWDAYKDETAAAKFEDLQGTADCNDSAVWESEDVEADK
jgi:hypothetical protein